MFSVSSITIFGIGLISFLVIDPRCSHDFPMVPRSHPFFLPGPAGHGSEGHGDTGGSHLSWLGNLSAPVWMAGASISIDFFGWEVKQFIGSQWKFHFCQSCGFGWNLACNGKKSLIHPLGTLLVRLGSHRWLSLIHWITGIMFKNVQNSWFL